MICTIIFVINTILLFTIYRTRIVLKKFTKTKIVSYSFLSAEYAQICKTFCNFEKIVIKITKKVILVYLDM